jgi:putative RNA 2'-phosphotransferase
MEKQGISKLICYWLRHSPQDANLNVDDFGWANLDQILFALLTKNVSYDVEKLIKLNGSFDKVRWEIDVKQNRIRATHGHSFPVLLDEKEKTPPETLYHGTATNKLSSIIEQGLLAMNRQFVHLSDNVETAMTVGKRHGKPFVIEINTEELIENGWIFYQTSNNVWLTTKIPNQYLTFKPWIPCKDSNHYAVDELKREIGTRRLHKLYSHLDDLEVVGQSIICDDRLFADRKTGMYYMVHLTWRKEQEIDGYPCFNIHKTFEEWLDEELWEDNQTYYE